MEHRLPVLRFYKIAKATYQLIYPVFVVGDNPINREFTLTLDEALRLVPGGSQPLAGKPSAREIGRWCPGADLNHRHADFQSAALPLSYPGIWRV